MSDDLSRKRPQDASKVNIHEPWELDYWSRHFGVTKDKLIQAVKAVGPLVKDIEKHLKR